MPQSLVDEFSFEFPLPIEVLLLRTLGAALLCGLIGLERGAHRDPAGLRTNMLVGLAVATFCMITLYMMETLPNGMPRCGFDPIRLVVSTAELPFWRPDAHDRCQYVAFRAPIGLACGVGLWPVAFLASFAGIVILWLLRHLQSVAGLKDE